MFNAFIIILSRYNSALSLLNILNGLGEGAQLILNLQVFMNVCKSYVTANVNNVIQRASPHCQPTLKSQHFNFSFS